MTEFQAALVLAQLGRADAQLQKRQASAAHLDDALAGLKVIIRLAPEPRMTRRAYHMYIFRLDESALGISRDRFIEALNAEGVPASKGWYRPLYKNGIFQNGNRGPAHGIKSPFTKHHVSYTAVHCPVCEQVCRDVVWIPQNVLLADESHIHQLATAIQKVVSQAHTLPPTAARE